MVEGLKERSHHLPGAASNVVTAATGPAIPSPFAAQAGTVGAEGGGAGAPNDRFRVVQIGAGQPPTARQHAVYAVLSITVLTLQTTATGIVLRYSRTEAGTKYLPSIAVLITEVLKLTICSAVQLWRHSSGADGAAFAAKMSLDVDAIEAGRPLLLAKPIHVGTTGSHQRRWDRWLLAAGAHARHALPMALPASMFVSQQVLLIAAATYLDAVTYQVFNQAFKLVPTAIFAYYLLGQRLERLQWASIPVLAAGVILVTVNTGAGGAGQRGGAVSAANWWLGMVSCCLSGLSSAFAGVYFERYVKGRLSASLWVRNIQLGVFAVPFSAAWAMVRDGEAIRRAGAMQGFSHSAWGLVALQVCGGLVTGCVVKYSDNIQKNFALAISVILTVLVAIPLFGQWPASLFLAGVLLVVVSVCMYGGVLNAASLVHWAAALQKGWGSADIRQRAAAAIAAVALSVLALARVLPAHVQSAVAVQVPIG